MLKLGHVVVPCAPNSHPLHPSPPSSTPTQARDPIPQLKKFMLEQGLATEDDIKGIHDK